MNEALQRLRMWGLGVLERWKAAALCELDPRNPDKRRFLCAWGLLVSGGLLLIIGMAFLLTFH